MRRKAVQTLLLLAISIILMLTSCTVVPFNVTNQEDSTDTYIGTIDSVDVETVDPSIDPSEYPTYILKKLTVGPLEVYEETLDQITLRVTPDRSVYEDGAKITFTVTLTNGRDTDIAYYFGGSMLLRLSSQETESIPSDEKTVFLTVPKGESVTVTLTFESEFTNHLWISSYKPTLMLELFLRETEENKPFTDRMTCTVLLPVIVELAYPYPETLAEEIRTRYYELYGDEQGIESVDSIQLLPVDEFRGIYVLYVNHTAETVEPLVKREEIDEKIFTYPSSDTPDVYYNGTFYKLKGAFDAGILTSEDIAALHEIWSNANPDLYGMT